MITMKMLDRAIAEQERIVMRRLQREYSIALKAIRAELAEYTAKYGVQGVLTQENMMKYNRLARMEKDINRELGRISQITTNQVKAATKQSYIAGYMISSYEISKQARVGISFGKIPKTQVERAAGNQYLLIALEENGRGVRRRIRNDITQGIIRGLAVKDIGEMVQESLQKNLNNANRIARTETMRARNMGSFDSYQKAEDLGIDIKRQWISSLDDSTRVAHQEADGQIRGIDEPFDVDGEELMYPLDESGSPENTINCRCTTIPIVDDIRPNTRASKAGQIDANISYKEWKDTQVF